MKKNVIIGSVFVIMGLLIALGPQVLFKVCTHGESGFPLCHWTAQAEIGIGLLIAALGICMIVFSDLKTHLGLSIGLFMAGLIALFIPHSLIGGCLIDTMACRKVAFPALTVKCIVVMILSATVLVYCEIKSRKPN
ncbi:MAG: DUF4418 family protein [Treponema sp.]|nr:DUF4418 family protein [Treponema sp.]